MMVKYKIGDFLGQPIYVVHYLVVKNKMMR